jgi:hypothetical protein
MVQHLSSGFRVQGLGEWAPGNRVVVRSNSFLVWGLGLRPQHVAKTAGCQKKPPIGVIFPSFGAILLIPTHTHTHTHTQTHTQREICFLVIFPSFGAFLLIPGGEEKGKRKIGNSFSERQRNLLTPVSEWGLGLWVRG